MRALAPDEIALLRHLSLPGLETEVQDTSLHEALVARGCVTEYEAVDSDGDLCDFYDINDLGRLALRVSAAAQSSLTDCL